jgi:uncharacterized membrane protein (UPF0127 family)
MRRRVVVVAMLVGTVGTALAAPEGKAPRVELKAATTETQLKGFGVAKPVTDRKVKVTFSHDSGSGYSVIASQEVKVRLDGSYVSTFERPETGNCKLVARYRTSAGTAKETEELNCGRPEFGTGSATFQSEVSKTIDVEVAQSSSQRSYGLMFRKHLGAERGMAFLFGNDSSGAFWMMNTHIPLSIAFYDSTGEIVSILDMEPCDPDEPGESCPVYDPEATYVGAIEVNKGAFDEWGVQLGDIVVVTQDL